MRTSRVLPPGEPPYPLPRVGAPVRLTFVGDPASLQAHALRERSARVRTVCVALGEGTDAGAVLDRVRASAPHVVVAFEPELLPQGVFADLRAPVVGFLTEPGARTQGRRARRDLRRRRAELARIDAGNVDRLVCLDPLAVPIADAVAPVWRSAPPPVADHLYAPVRPPTARPSILFVGHSTEHREAFLAGPTAELGVHLASAVDAAELEPLMRRHDVAVNLHLGPDPSFEHQVCLHLAAGHLVVSEPLSPAHGLEPGIDYLEVGEPSQLLAQLRAVSRFPRGFQRVRVRGRRKAEAFRASRVYPRLVADLLVDLRVFGTGRAAAR